MCIVNGDWPPSKHLRGLCTDAICRAVTIGHHHLSSVRTVIVNLNQSSCLYVTTILIVSRLTPKQDGKLFCRANLFVENFITPSISRVVSLSMVGFS